MATLSNVVCLVIHRNVIHRFIVQVLQDPLLCSSTIWVPLHLSFNSQKRLPFSTIVSLVTPSTLPSPSNVRHLITGTPILIISVTSEMNSICIGLYLPLCT